MSKTNYADMRGFADGSFSLIQEHVGQETAVTATGNIKGRKEFDLAMQPLQLSAEVTVALSGTGSLEYRKSDDTVMATLALTSGTAAGTILTASTIVSADDIDVGEIGKFYVATACDAGSIIPVLKFVEKFKNE
jgi:hypothetical protein